MLNGFWLNMLIVACSAGNVKGILAERGADLYKDTLPVKISESIEPVY